MIIIYHCSGGTHSSVLAANIHLGILPEDRIPDADEMLQKTNFDRSNKKRWGLINKVGYDEHGSLVCTLGRRFSIDITIQALNSLSILFDKKEELQLINIHNDVNFLMKIGGTLSRGLHMVGMGRPIVIKGSQAVYPNIVEVVKNVKQRLYNI
ncbi:DUF3189 family protein [Petroclostridium sp. X23]|uniref:DUF3189 family protein n=1 Tax=Petroclostridium sp. X23 TaxID=3045146 RepID=UPI0024ADAB35|nr:DUF3189 family protein [Petroclostridium sp. X23]WHH59504.1 DUF3189 family protein [Petroclostridium sp. X23]